MTLAWRWRRFAACALMLVSGCTVFGQHRDQTSTVSGRPELEYAHVKASNADANPHDEISSNAQISPERELSCSDPRRRHFADVPARGYHVFMSPNNPQFNCGANPAAVVVAQLHVDGTEMMDPIVVEFACNVPLTRLQRKIVRGVEVGRPRVLQQAESNLTADAYLELSTRVGMNRWAYFSPLGRPLRTTEQVTQALFECGKIYIFEGGNFMWPGVSIGYQFRVSTGDAVFGDVVVTTLSLKPLIFSIDPLLTDAECDHIITKATPSMANSGVSHVDSDIGKPATNWRTSTQARLPNRADSVVTGIERRVHGLMRVPEDQGEPLQVLRYLAGQKYDAHNDFFDPDLYKGQPAMMRSIENGNKNRFATLLWYMNDVDTGGETHFPRAGGGAQPRNFLCVGGSELAGLRVRPEKRKATLFFSLRPDGAPDPFSLHGGCPPGQGSEKWAVNKWVWSKKY